jgi:hypothetical protein
MLHIIGHLVLALGLLRWLTWELKKPFEPKKHGILLIFTILFAILGLFLSELSTSGQGIGNALMHAVGGGMATACTYQYVKRNLNLHINWRLEVAFLFLFVSGFGVLNELIEYVAELGGYGIFSLDSHDTWRDFVANSTGAYAVLLSVYSNQLFHKKAKQ